MIDKEKREWMKSVGIIEFPEPVSYMYQFKGHDTIWLRTEQEIVEKTLEELKTMYEKDKEFALECVKTLGERRMRKVIYSE